MKTKYRIVDRIEPQYATRDIVVQKQTSWLDKLFKAWYYVAMFHYNDDKTTWPHKNRVEAIAEAKKFIEDLEAGKLEKKETVIKEF